MASFSDKITLTVDILTGKASSSPFKSIRDEVDQTEGSFGKLKAAGSGAFDFIKQNAAGFALGAGTALAGFAVKAVGDFQDVALQAGEVSDALGISTEEASRLNETAGDLGIGIGTLESSIGRMNKTAATSPDKFAAIGAELARNKDGSLDVIKTFENVATALNNIPDPAARAKAASDIFGKGWMSMAELIQQGGAGIRDTLASVEKAKVVNPEQVARAREFRDQLDQLKGIAESAAITIGGRLVESIGAMIDKAEDLGGAVAAAAKVIDDQIPKAAKDAGISLSGAWKLATSSMKDSLEFGPKKIQELGDRINDLRGGGDIEVTLNLDPANDAIDETTGKLEGLTPAASAGGEGLGALGGAAAMAAEKVREAADAAAEDEAATEQAAEANERMEKAARDAADALNAEADALNGQVDAMQDSADAALDAEGAQQDFIDSVAKATWVNADATSTSDDKRKAVDSERDAMIAAAKAQQELSDKNAAAAGKTASARERIDAFNTSLLNNAHFATPEAAAAIADYINKANAVPEKESTDIKAAIVAGDFETADRLLREVSRARSAAITADADTAQANRELDNLARTRIATIRVQTTGGAPTATRSGYGSVIAQASGGRVKAGQPTWVGDRDGINSRAAELFVPDTSGTVYNQEQIAAASGGGGSPMTGGGGATYNVTINAGIGANGADLGKMFVEAVKRYERSNGTGWRAA